MEQVICDCCNKAVKPGEWYYVFYGYQYCSDKCFKADAPDDYKTFKKMKPDDFDDSTEIFMTTAP